VIPALLLATMVLLAGLSNRTGKPSAVALAVVSVLWLLTNNPMEGPILVTLSADHGITGGDLAGLAGLAVAAWRFRVATRTRTPHDRAARRR
jgi:hypothetical protein